MVWQFLVHSGSQKEAIVLSPWDKHYVEGHKQRNGILTIAIILLFGLFFLMLYVTGRQGFAGSEAALQANAASVLSFWLKNAFFSQMHSYGHKNVARKTKNV